MEVEDDGLRFDPQGVQAGAIREEMEYGGIRVRLTATLDGARIPLQIDVGFGDAVTPRPEEVDYPTLLDLPAPHLRVYPRESVVAEKFQAMVHLGMANSRMKDFYDVWMRIPVQSGHRFRCKVGHPFRSKLGQAFRCKLGH